MLIDDDDLPPAPPQYQLQRHWDAIYRRWGYRPLPIVLLERGDYWLSEHAALPWLVALNSGVRLEDLMSNGFRSSVRLYSHLERLFGCEFLSDPRYLSVAQKLREATVQVEDPDADR